MSNTNYPNLNPQLQNAKGAAINAKDAVVNSKVRGHLGPVSPFIVKLVAVWHISPQLQLCLMGVLSLTPRAYLFNEEAAPTLSSVVLILLSTVIPRF